MRNLTPATEVQTQQRLGTEPINIIKIDWFSGTRYYSDKSFTLGSLNIDGRITDFSSISAQVSNKSLGSVESASVTLSDTDGVLKQYFDNAIIIGRDVTVYQYFEGLTETDLVPVLIGRINTPVTWDEATRTLSLTIYNDVDDDDVLLQIKEPSVDFPSDEDIGKVLPLCFGTVLRLPSIELNRSKSGELLGWIKSVTTWYSNNDPDKAKITIMSADFRVSGFEDISPDKWMVLEVDNTLFYGHMNPNDNQDFIVNLSGFNYSYDTVKVISRSESDPDYDNPSVIWIDDATADMVGKFLYINWLEDYLQLETTDPYTGKQIIQPIGETEAGFIANDYPNLPIEEVHEFELYVCEVTSQEGNKLYLNKDCLDKFGRQVLLDEKATIKHIVGKPEYRWEQLADLNDPLTWIIGPGARVTVYNGDSPLFVVNSVPSEEILEVAAYREGVLTAVPSNYYTQYLDYTCIINGKTEHLTVLDFFKGMHTSEGWNDSQVFVSLRSSIHSNTATDVLKWITENRTNLTMDPVSSGTVGSAIQNYPSHFAILSQRSALQAIGEIAWQARLGTYIDAGKMYLHYLSQESVPVLSIGPPQIKMKSLTIEKTNSDNIFTKFEAHWNKTYEEKVPRKIITQRNVNDYPDQDYDVDFTIYNIENLVKKSNTFWANRMSTEWMFITFETFLTTLKIQIWDSVSITLPFLNNGQPVTGVVETISHNTDTHQIQLGIWLPLNPTGNEPYLSDAGDQMPNDPAEGLSPLDYPVIVKRLKMTRVRFKRLGPHATDNAALDDANNRTDETSMPTLRQSRVKLVVIHFWDNHLTCTRANDYEAARRLGKVETLEYIHVALPLELRRKYWDKKETKSNVTSKPVKYTYLNDQKRRADGYEYNEDTEAWEHYSQEEQITPIYIPGYNAETDKYEVSPTIITAAYIPDGTGVFNSNNLKICWQDINEAGRAWAKTKELEAW